MRDYLYVYLYQLNMICGVKVVHLVKGMFGVQSAGALSCPRGEREGASAGLGACDFGGMVSEEPRAWSLRLRAQKQFLKNRKRR